MSRRTRRVLPLLLTVALGLGLSSCGDDDGDAAAAGTGIDAVSVEGEVGAAPDVTFDGEMSVDELTTETLTEGEGAEVAEGDQVLTHIWIGNGFTKKQAFSTYDEETPQLLTVDKNLSKIFLEGLEGQTIGSRVAVAAPAEDAFGPEGNPQLGIGNKDSVLVVIDLLSGVADGPDGAESRAPGWAPKIVEKDGEPTAFDFAGTPEPGAKLKTSTLIEGEGETVEKAQTVVVNYLGQVYDGKKPFDENFSAAPISFPIGVGKVVKGWDQGLVGQTVGSRVLLAIPPKLGYGEQGNAQAGIKGTDTLFFVVDLLAAG